MPNHPRSQKKGGVREHILVAEKVLGKHLPAGAVVHHVNKNIFEHDGNLVICQDNSYHSFLHARQRAFEQCGHSSWRKCCLCHEWDAPENLYITPTGKQAYHRECGNEKQRTLKALRKLQNPKPPRKYDNRNIVTGRFIIS